MSGRVLVAEDDRAIRESLRRMLSLDGFDVAVATDGIQALAAARTTAYDLLILDVLMPGLDGLQVCRTLREEGNRAPVLILTAGPEAWPPAMSRDAGAEEYLPKPFDPQDLLTQVHTLIPSHGAPVPTHAQAHPLSLQAEQSPTQASKDRLAADTGRGDLARRPPIVHQPRPVRPGTDARHDRLLASTCLALLASVAALWMITRLGVPGLDSRLHQAVLRHRGTTSLTIARELTQGGSTYVIWPLSGLAALIFPRTSGRGRWLTSAAFAAAVGAGIGVRLAVSVLIARPRPPMVDWASAAGGYAFPSGHTAAATVGAGALAWAVARRTSRRGIRLCAWAIAAVYAAAVGWSRIWLGVHWGQVPGGGVRRVVA